MTAEAPVKTESAYIRHLQDLARQRDLRAERLSDVTAACWALGPDFLPPVEMMNTIGSPDEGHFKSAMLAMFQELVQRGGLTEASRILDLGCGCGRLAVPFARLLESGVYYGVDVWDDGIAWCHDHLTAINPNMRFILRESANNYYFEARDEEASNAYHLREIGDGGVDFAFAISVFTHLVAEDCEAYFRELARVLGRGGVAYITCFIIDKYFFEYVRLTGMHKAVSEEAVGCYYAYQGQDFFAGYTFQKWRAMLEASGLRIVSSDLGTWADKPGARAYQDTFIVVSADYARL